MAPPKQRRRRSGHDKIVDDIIPQLIAIAGELTQCVQKMMECLNELTGLLRDVRRRVLM